LCVMNHSLIWERTVCEIVQKSKIFTRNYDTRVISNIMGFSKLFIVGGRSFMYVIKSKVPRIDPWGTACFAVPQFDRIWNILQLFLECHKNVI
jgi:hypothetical protein